jgi:hypothetical protein
MTLQSITFLGVDLSLGRRPFTFAALDEEQHILVLGEGELVDALSYTAGLPQAVVAVNAPARLNNGCMAEPVFRMGLEPQPPRGRWNDLRVAEYLLVQQGLSVPYTPARLEHCPLWMRTGFRFYQALETELEYQPYPQDGGRRWLEVQTDACYAALLGIRPFPAPTLEGRIQRQLALQELKLKVPDAMDLFEEITRYKILHGILPLDNLYSAGELSALAAAYTAWLAGNQPERLHTLGEAAEGLLYLPVPAEPHP